MCTVSWLHTADGYQLLSNRDEKHTRAVAAPPSVHLKAGVRFLAPADGSHGGAWIAANEYGLSLCLLNSPPNSPTSGEFLSRGFIIPSLIASTSIPECQRQLDELHLDSFLPFILLMLHLDNTQKIAVWDGVRLRHVNSNRPILASSSFDFDGVGQARRNQFDQAASSEPLTESMLMRFHASHADGPSAYSPCMHRSDASTVSLTSIRVTPASVECLYYPDAPCCRPQPRAAAIRRSEPS
jgi:hypothetical protein